MKILKRGAEAILVLDTYEGKKAVIKRRIKKSYRIKELDERLRLERTRREAKLLREARMIGVPTPQIYRVDEKNCTIYMQYIEGEKVKDVLDEMKRKQVESLFEKIGYYIGKLHSHGIVHGDLTTSNIILSNNDIYFIDFGLGFFSKRTEDFGVDLKLLKEAIEATHPKLLNVCWKSIVKGYRRSFEKADEALKKVDEIEKRGRYVHR